MKEYTKAEVDDMREMLANSEWEGLQDRDLREVLWDGCVGWNNMTKEEVVENWENIYGELGD